MKLKDFILKINKGVIDSNELEALAGSDTISKLDVEVTDEEAEKIIGKLGGMLTLEDAQEHPEVVNAVKQKYYPQHKKTALQEFESLQQNAVKDLLGDEGFEAIKGIEYAKERQEKINELIKAKIEKLSEGGKKSGNSDEVKELVDKYNQLETDFNSYKEEAQNKLTEQEQGFKTALTKRAFTQKAISKPWADNYDDRVKRAIIKEVFDEVSSEAALKLNDKDEVDLLDKESQELAYRPKGATKAMNLDEVLDQKLNAYYKKNNNGDGDDPGKQTPPTGGKFADTKRKVAAGSMASAVWDGR